MVFSTDRRSHHPIRESARSEQNYFYILRQLSTGDFMQLKSGLRSKAVVNSKCRSDEGIVAFSMYKTHRCFENETCPLYFPSHLESQPLQGSLLHSLKKRTSFPIPLDYMQARVFYNLQPPSCQSLFLP